MYIPCKRCYKGHMRKRNEARILLMTFLSSSGLSSEKLWRNVSHIFRYGRFPLFLFGYSLHVTYHLSGCFLISSINDSISKLLSIMVVIQYVRMFEFIAFFAITYIAMWQSCESTNALQSLQSHNVNSDIGTESYIAVYFIPKDTHLSNHHRMKLQQHRISKPYARLYCIINASESLNRYRCKSEVWKVAHLHPA